MSAGGVNFRLYNSFTNSNPYSGSQCAVILFPAGDPRLQDEVYLQNVASYFNFPATSFIAPIQEGNQTEYNVRWFSSQELKGCGHGTLAASQFLFDTLPPAISELKLHTLFSGVYTAKRKTSAGQAQVEMSLPLAALDGKPLDEQGRQNILTHLLDGASLKHGDIVNIATYAWGGTSLIIEIDPNVDLAKLNVQPLKLQFLTTGQIAITQAVGLEENTLSIQSRVFLPHYGTPEDPVTGSAHAALTGYYTSHPSPVSRLLSSLADPKSITINAIQLSTRGGAMTLRNSGDGRAIILGTATEIGQGSLNDLS